MKGSRSLIVPLFLLLPACSASKEMESEASTIEKKEEEERVEKGRERATEGTVTIKERGWDEKASDPYSFKSAAIEGDSLRLVVSYSGGCEEHEFELLTDKAYTKSAPPSLRLFLFHDAKGDACRSVVTDSLSYDLSPLQHPKSDSLKYHLKGHERPLHHVY